LDLKRPTKFPFSFNKKGNLVWNTKALNKLSKEQLKIAQNIVDAIKSKDYLDIQLVNKDKVVRTEVVKDLKPGQTMLIGGKPYKNGDVANTIIEDAGGGWVNHQLLVDMVNVQIMF
jgi:hypothetical protein